MDGWMDRQTDKERDYKPILVLKIKAGSYDKSSLSAQGALRALGRPQRQSQHLMRAVQGSMGASGC
jgi:hypothetical protein